MSRVTCWGGLWSAHEVSAGDVVMNANQEDALRDERPPVVAALAAAGFGDAREVGRRGFRDGVPQAAEFALKPLSRRASWSKPPGNRVDMWQSCFGVSSGRRWRRLSPRRLDYGRCILEAEGTRTQ